MYITRGGPLPCCRISSSRIFSSSTLTTRFPTKTRKTQEFCKTYLPVFTCPSDLRAHQIFAPETIAPDGGSQPNPPILYMAGSYKAMTGFANTSGTYGGFWNEVQSAKKDFPSVKAAFHGDGASGMKPEKRANFADGLSNAHDVGSRLALTQF